MNQALTESPFDFEPDPLLWEPSAIFLVPFHRAYAIMDNAWKYHGWTFRADGGILVVWRGEGHDEQKVDRYGCGCPRYGWKRSCPHANFVGFAGGVEVCLRVANQFTGFMTPYPLEKKLEATLAVLNSQF